MEKYSGESILHIVLATMKLASQPPGFKILHHDNRQILASFDSGERTYLLSLNRFPASAYGSDVPSETVKDVWAVGFTDKEEAESGKDPQELTGLAGHGSLRVFNHFIQGLLYLVDRFDLQGFVFGGDEERMRLYNRLLERTKERNPELAEKWKLDWHGKTDHPIQAGKKSGFWVINRVNNKKDQEKE